VDRADESGKLVYGHSEDDDTVSAEAQNRNKREAEDDDFAEWLRSGADEAEADGTLSGAEAEPGKATGSAD
jgi:hypothetical protein